jgi:hypothetical protein
MNKPEAQPGGSLQPVGSVKTQGENGTRSDSAPKVQAETATAETRQGRGNRLGVTISPNDKVSDSRE